LAYFTRTCERYGVTDPKEKYLGLTQYCSTTVSKFIRSLPSHAKLDYSMLVDELKYFYAHKEVVYSIDKVEAFTAKWRKKQITNLSQFKGYHMKYLELVGEAREGERITMWDYNRYFWEGLPDSLRQKIENRMININPELDVAVPFKISKVVKAAEHILSPHRFDRHLLAQTGYDSSEEEDSVPRPKHQPKGRSTRSQQSSSEDSEDDIQPLFKPKPPTPPRSPSKRKEVTIKKNDEIDDMLEKLVQTDADKPEFRTLSIKILRKEPNLKAEIEKLCETIRTAQHKPNLPRNSPRPP